MGLGRASLPPSGRGCPPVLRAALTCASWSSAGPHHQGRSWSPGRGGRRRAMGGTQGGKTVLDLGPGRSLSLSTDLASQAPLPKPVIPSSCFLCASRLPAGARGAASSASGAASRPGMAAAGQGGRMSSQLWNRSLWRRSAKACHLSPECQWEVGLSFLTAFADSNLPVAEDRLLGQPGELGGGRGRVRWAPRSGRSWQTNPISMGNAFSDRRLSIESPPVPKTAPFKSLFIQP